MTMKQKKGIRTAVLTLLFVLLVIGTFFDSRHGNLDVQAESIVITSEGSSDLWNEIEPPRVEKMTISQAAPEAPIKTVPTEKTIEIKKPEIKKAEVPAVGEADKKVAVVEGIQESVTAEPAPTPWNSSTDGEDDHQLAREPAPWPKPEPRSRLIPDPGDGQTPEAGKDRKKDYGSDGDRNRGHGNDEDGYDEDNPGRGGIADVNSSKRRNGHRASGSRGACGKSGRCRGSKKK